VDEWLRTQPREARARGKLPRQRFGTDGPAALAAALGASIVYSIGTAR
jgi:hypothetical protein